MPTPADQPVTVAYYYRTLWGKSGAFMELFLRNHWPILREQQREGRYTDVSLYVPRFHGDGRADWDVMVTITYRDWASIAEHTDPALIARLFPDTERHHAEEDERFSLLDAHWDVVLEQRDLPAD